MRQWSGSMLVQQIVRITLALACLESCGCGSGAANPVAPESATSRSIAAPSSEAAGIGVPTAAVVSATEAIREDWDAFYIEGTWVGYGMTRYEPVDLDGRRGMHIRGEQSLHIHRFGQRISQQIRLDSWELTDGRLVRFSSEMNDGVAKIAALGRVVKGKLEIEHSTLGNTATSSLDWDPAWGGFFAAEQRLEQKPMAPGESRSFMQLLPMFNKVVQMHLKAIEYESTDLLDGQRELLRIESRIQIEGVVIDSLVWTDERGTTLKTVLPALNQVSFRTTKERALAEASKGQPYDLGPSSVVKVERKLTRPHETTRIVYRARLPNADPSQEFATGSRQSVRRIDEHTAEITVRAVRPPVTEPVDAAGDGGPPGPAETQPNGFLQSDDPEVVALAGTIAPDEKDPWRLAMALERAVRDAVRTREFSPAIATAADVARSREGDCTEHAVLLAALCRARGIPSRVAIGLVYFEPVGGFAYHMWTEVWTDQHWISLDATLGRGGIGAGHLKITHSNLEGSESLSAFLPVFKLLGQLQLEILDVEGDGNLGSGSQQLPDIENQ